MFSLIPVALSPSFETDVISDLMHNGRGSKIVIHAQLYVRSVYLL